MRRRRRALATSLLLAGALGCSKKEPPPAPAQALGGMPPLAEQPSAAELPPNHPATPHATAAAPAAGTPVDPHTVITGLLRLDDKVKDKVSKGDTIFLMARSFDKAGVPGVLLAAKKLTVGGWPLPFSIDNRDAMASGTELKGPVVVSARVDKDSDATTKNPGDVVGTSRPLGLPVSRVVITLDTVL